MEEEQVSVEDEQSERCIWRRYVRWKRLEKREISGGGDERREGYQVEEIRQGMGIRWRKYQVEVVSGRKSIRHKT